MGKKFSTLLCDNLTDSEYVSLRKMKRQRKTRCNPSQYKIIITQDRCDYDNLSELADHPEKGCRVGTFYFSTPNQLDLILKAFEGLFYQMFQIAESNRFGGGIVDDSIYEEWWDEECCCVCESCFLRGEMTQIDDKWHYKCRKK